MNTWQEISTFAWHQGIGYLIGSVLFIALLLYRLRPADRRTLKHTLFFFAICLMGLFISGSFHHLGMAKAASILHEIFIVAEGIVLIRLCGMLVFRVLLPAARLDTPSILEDMLVIVGYLIWGMVRLRYAGMDLSGIVTTSAVITAVIAFSMQDTLGNILGGLALELDNSIQVGDWIKVDDVVGKVVDIRWRSTSIETRNWETVIIPNSVLMKSKFSVLGKRVGQPELWRRWVWFNVDYNIPPARVIEIVEKAIQSADIQRVAHEPRPNCVMMDFDKSSARYAVRYWLTDLAVDDPTDSTVRAHIYAALQRADIRLPVPEGNIHLFKEGEKHNEIRLSRETAHRMKTLRKVDLFRSFSDEELNTVASRLKYAPFVRGDIMTKQGAVAHWLYILTEGEAEVVLESSSGNTTLSTIHAGSFFGEMGMMTGAPRSTTVIAKTDVECYRLDKESFESIIQSRPSIAEEISQILVARQTELHSVQDGIAAAQHSHTQANTEILTRIKKFFGLLE
ncbi:MAG: mechanosensitive ion channel family protein [Gammaproteobacteria bacterium]|nr:mechanosensitive ion channel family protein [Gammaproteobacteria bacterium]MBU1731154.1 mechanosensitive ion channel family protein [Gammaproteobacteria bacterium]MBU1891465.1 mechanosensitive ion channel family protein [Gammaproteobacteria bacterium]